MYIILKWVFQNSPLAQLYLCIPYSNFNLNATFLTVILIFFLSFSIYRILQLHNYMYTSAGQYTVCIVYQDIILKCRWQRK